MGASEQARIWAVVGASGTGKGLWVKRQLRQLRPDRLIIWDTMGEYGEYAQRVDTLGALHAALVRAGPGTVRIRYVPRGNSRTIRGEFEACCELVQAAGSAVFVAEELSQVTTPSWAPAAWRKMTTSGRHAGLHVIGCTQSPALVDKSFLGNATLAHCGALREHSHRQAMARAMDLGLAELAALPNLHWIERDYQTRAVTRGVEKIPGKRAPTPRGAATLTDPAGQA